MKPTVPNAPYTPWAVDERPAGLALATIAYRAGQMIANPVDSMTMIPTAKIGSWTSVYMKLATPTMHEPTTMNLKVPRRSTRRPTIGPRTRTGIENIENVRPTRPGLPPSEVSHGLQMTS